MYYLLCYFSCYETKKKYWFIYVKLQFCNFVLCSSFDCIFHLLQKGGFFNHRHAKSWAPSSWTFWEKNPDIFQTSEKSRVFAISWFTYLENYV